MLRKAIGILPVILLASVYLISSLGFAVHRCSCCDTVNVISLLEGKVECDDIHPDDPHHHHATHHHGYAHSADRSGQAHPEELCYHSLETCCDTEVLLLKIDQDAPDDNTLPHLSLDGLILPEIPETFIAENRCRPALDIRYTHVPLSAVRCRVLRI